jgi:BirA family biotin operon repressor/biotin-[acetyl-CoA-carboxylase] ligase
MWSPDAALLTALRGSSLHLPATELAAQAGLEPAALAVRLEGLRAAGFEFEHHPTLGFRFVSAPDRLIADDLWARLAIPSGEHPPLADFLREILVLEETGSTNDVAAGLGRQGAAGGVLVLAETQTSGRGRFGRRWASASHRGLWLSLLVRPTAPLGEWPRLTTWAAVCVAAAVDRFSPTPATIKWPNDVLLEGRKVAGILIEMGTDARGESFAVVGIGLNVNHEADDFPPELADLAQSIRLVAGTPIDRSALLVALLQELHTHWPNMQNGFDRLVATASRRSTLLGRWVTVRQGDTLLEGMAESLDANGQLLLRTANGELLHLSAGEVTFHT